MTVPLQVIVRSVAHASARGAARRRLAAVETGCADGLPPCAVGWLRPALLRWCQQARDAGASSSAVEGYAHDNDICHRAPLCALVLASHVDVVGFSLVFEDSIGGLPCVERADA